MAKRSVVRALIIEQTSTSATEIQTEQCLAEQLHETVIALLTARVSSSRPNKRACSSAAEQPRLVDDEETVPPEAELLES